MADSDGLRVLGLVAMLGVAFFAVRYATGASVSSSSADAGFLRSLVPSLQLRERDLGGAAEARKDFCRIFRSQRPGDTNGSVFLVTDGDGAVAGAATSPQPVIGVLAKGSGVLDNLEIEGARRAFRERLYAMLDARGMAPVAVLGLDANSPQMVSFASTVERQLTISAGMKVLEASCWFPMYAEFLQPRFVIVVSEMSRCVKVVTYAYVGNNSRGDRPTTKHTDWVCRIVTSNLLLGAAAALGSAAGQLFEAYIGTADAPTLHDAQELELQLQGLTVAGEGVLAAVEAESAAALSAAKGHLDAAAEAKVSALAGNLAEASTTPLLKVAAPGLDGLGLGFA